MKKTAIEIGDMIKKGEISSVEITKNIIKSIKEKNSILNVYTEVFEEEAIKKAIEVQKKIDKKELKSKLAGVPIAIKDNIFIKGKNVTACSSFLKNFVAPYNATVIKKLEDAGAIIIGKLNMDEFAMGGSNQTSCFGPVRNPYDLERVAGGSSGGSSSAVGSDLAFYTLGTDTGGSIRQPASFCNSVGFKPTYGSISRYGVIPLSPSLDQVGPITKDVKDCASVLEIISGYDRNDSSTFKTKAFNFENCYKSSLKGFKIGVPKNYFDEDLDEDVKKAVLDSINIFKSLDAEIEEFELDLNEASVATYYILSCAEAISAINKYGFKEDTEKYIKARSESFGLTVKTRIMLGNLVLTNKYYDIYYQKALKFRTYIINTFKEVFSKFDLLLTPVCQTPAFKIGEILTKEEANRRYFGDIYTVATNLAGIPAISIPCGFSRENLPIGLQLIGGKFSDEKIITAGYTFQNITDFHKKEAF